MKTFRDYLNECRFEDVWNSMVENFSEPEEIKPVYAEYYEKLKGLPHKPVKGVIDLSGGATEYPDGMNGAPDWLIDKAVKTNETDSAVVVATLLYWASLHTFYTSQEHDADLFRYLEIIESQDLKAYGEYLTESMKSKPYRSEIEESRERKEKLFWKDTFSCLCAGDWRYTLYIMKRKLQYDMGFMRGFSDHAARERDADRMQLCCNLIDGATAHIYPDKHRRRMLHLLFKVLDQYITEWGD
jgi:hypothetical protein